MNFFKMIDYKKIFLNLYFFLFIFTMINREFLFFNIDLRYILLPIGLIEVIYGLIKKEYKKNKKNIKYIIILYFWILISNISWLWNGLNIDIEKFVNEIILIINIIVGIYVVWIYDINVNSKLINKYIVFACMILTLSFILIQCGFSLKQISGSNENYIAYVTEDSPEHKNIYNGNFRLSGYAQDPNYASMFFILGIVACLQLELKKIYKYTFISIFLVSLGFSCSKTIVFACLIGIIYILGINIIKNKVNNKVINVINIVMIITIIGSTLVIPYISSYINFIPSTISTRFIMWKEAFKLFTKSPIIGNGITSFRSFFAEQYWYVQCHSTYWQILSETGIIGLILLVNVIKNLLFERKSSKFKLFITFVYLIFAINFETIALQFIVYILVILDCSEEKNNEVSIKVGKKALFMINSLSNGGAERVCINMANQLLKMDYKVDFILIGSNIQNKQKYSVNPKIKIYNLNINENNKIKKIYKIFLAKNIVNRIILNNEKSEKYCLITSHLPMSNFLTRISNVKNRALYVFHLNISHYDKYNSKIFKLCLNLMFKNKKVVTVSKGVENEATSIYGMHKKWIKTIYNPINVDDILKKENESIDLKEKYILHVGRFSQQKRQDRMVDIYYKGKFYKTHKLVFCGTGDLENAIKDKVKELGISKQVIFLGWQSNIYKWMKNCDLLVCTSDNEAFPMTLIEALSCNIKVVSSNCKFGPNEILLNEYSNFLVTTDNIDEYIEKMNKAINSYPKTEKYILDKCKAENVVNQYINFAKQIIVE